MTRYLLPALLLGATLASAQANTVADYAYVFPLDMTAAPEQGNVWRVDLTPEVYSWVQDTGLRDVEIFNGAGRPVPLARWSAPTIATTTTHTATLPSLALPASAPVAAGDLRLVIDRDANGRLRRLDAGEQATADAPARARDWLLDASAVKHPIDRLVLAWSAPASGVVARFAIAASDDLQRWRDLGSASVLALEQDGARLERRDIAIDSVRANYFRLHRLDDGADLIGLSAQARSANQDTSAPVRSWLDGVAIVQDPAATTANRPHFEYRLPASIPIDSIRIRLADTDTAAPLILSGRLAGGEWRELARLSAFRLRAGSELIENEDIALSGAVHAAELRIESGVPLAEPPRLALGYRADSFVFLAESEGPYRLAVGSAQARHPDYPLEAALASMRARFGRDWQPSSAHLGAMRESAGPSALAPPPAPTPWRRWLLWGVLAAGAATVGGFALSLLRSAHRKDGQGPLEGPARRDDS